MTKSFPYSNYLLILNEIKIKLEKLYKKKYSSKYKTKKDFQVDPVTEIDLKSELIIRNIINKYFPDHNIIGEEYNKQDKKSDYTWIIDPIDGTKSFIMGLPNWSNLIGLYYKDECILSWANFPKLQKYYIAYKKQCWLIEKNKKKLLKCNNKIALINCKVVINTLHSLRSEKIFKFIMKFKGFFKVTGVDSLNFCSIAEGKFDVLIESGLKEVDILPIYLIVKNSGAIISDWNGGNNFSKGEVLVSPDSKIHKYFLKKIQ